MPGALVLLGGEPGIGKSTLVLEIAAGVARGAAPASRVTPTAAPTCCTRRARNRRTSCICAPIAWGSPRVSPGRASRCSRRPRSEAILAAAESIGPGLLVVDSVQTLTADGLEGPAGSVGQVRESAARLAAWSHEHGTPVSSWAT